MDWGREKGGAARIVTACGGFQGRCDEARERPTNHGEANRKHGDGEQCTENSPQLFLGSKIERGRCTVLGGGVTSGGSKLGLRRCDRARWQLEGG